MKEKNLSIELLKFMAVIIVMNGHMDVLYGKYSALATGGAIGDALFFFVSGFTIFLGRSGRFDNWYKRRIKRIYPSLIAWIAFLSFADLKQLSLCQIINGGGYWFISCIMLYYVVLYYVRKYAGDKPMIPFILCGCVVFTWYCFENKETLALYGNNYFKWMFFFLFMLAGAYVGNGAFKIKTKSRLDVIWLVLSILLFYGIQHLGGKSCFMNQLQILTLIPLMGVVFYLYKLCCTEGIVKMMNTKWGLSLRFIAGLCLEAYIVQVTLIPLMAERLSSLFPWSLIITFLVVIVVAYLTRCTARFFSQLFEKEDFDWRAVFAPIN